MISQTDLNYINEQLALLFGIELDSRPKYRVVWAQDQFEHRRGEFELFAGPIYLRTEVGVRRVRKYPYYDGKYVLERLLWYSSPEIVDSGNGSYESIWLFVDKDDNYLPPNLEVCIRLIRHLEAPKVKKTPMDIEREEMARRRKRIEMDKLLLEEFGPSWLFYPGETGKQGVFIDSTKIRR